MAQYQEDCDDNLFNQFKIMLDSKNQDHVFGALLAINKVARIGRETRIVHRVKKIMPYVLKQLGSNNKELVERTADCLGILAEAGGKIPDSQRDAKVQQPRSHSTWTAWWTPGEGTGRPATAEALSFCPVSPAGLGRPCDDGRYDPSTCEPQN